MMRFLLLFLLLSFRCFCQEEIHRPDEQVMKAAEGQLDIFLEKIEPEQLATFGFTEKDDLDGCRVGKPFRVLEFSKEFFSAGELDDHADYLDIKNDWRVPVLIDGKYRSLLSVSGTSGNYAASALGDPALARELQQIISGISADESFYILRIYPLLAEFFVHESDNSFANTVFVPLTSARGSIPDLKNNPKNQFTAIEVARMVKRAINKETIAATPKINDMKKAAKEPKNEAPERVAIPENVYVADDRNGTRETRAKVVPKPLPEVKPAEPVKKAEKKAPVNKNIYVVEPGDNLASVARKNNVTKNQLLLWNDDVDPDHLKIGEKLHVTNPFDDRAKAEKKEAPPKKEEAAPAGGKFYVVQKGDMLSTIAKKNNTTVSQILKLNLNVQPDKIRDGQKLRVRE